MGSEKIDEELKCLKCAYLCFEDYGYSDWAVEGTMVICLKNRFDNRERACGEKEEKDERGVFEKAGENCPHYKKGDPLELNVEDDRGKEKAKRLSAVEKP